jgi:hypothetical protein
MVGGLALAVIVCRNTRYVPLVLAACLFLPLVSFARANMTNLVLSFILADHLCQFLKRAIFVLGPQQMPVYYGFQSLSYIVLGVAGACALFLVRKDKWPPSVKFLILWVLIGLFDTGLRSPGVSLRASFVGFGMATAPVLAVFLGMAIPMSAWRSVARLFMALILISSVYGLIQYVGGYTVFDRAWAFATHAYSIQGSKVYDVLIGASDEIRAYSYYADHLTWGLFLAGAVLFVAACVSARLAPKRWLYVAIPPAVLGMVLCGTRTVWVGVLGALGVQRLISMRGFRRPLLVMAGIFTSFGLVLWLGGYLMSHGLFSGTVTNKLLRRYETTGTIEARVSAPEIFVEMLPSHFLIGDGFGANGRFGALEGVQSVFKKEDYSHNAVVDILMSTGLTGLIAIVLFLYSWLREAFWSVRASPRPTANALRWLIAITTGMVFTGGLNGWTFMTPYFYLTVGMVSGEWIRLQAARSRMALNLTLPVRSRPGTLARQA